jgi:putative copper export protein
VLYAALVLTAGERVPALVTAPERVGRAPQALGITAPALALPRWEVVRACAALLAAAYLLLVAFSGHAADVTPGWLSYPLDWLHLLSTAAWVGGIAALAYGVLPLRGALAPEERALAVLPLLDRFSPVAYLAVAGLALSGLYNAVNHLNAPARLADTTYGQLLVLKLLLVGLLLLLSSSHVWWLRPRIARAQDRAPQDARAMASLHEGLGALAGRLRLEAGVGAAVLLATALMGQTLPTTSAAPGPAPGAIPASISGTAVTGDLRAQLTVAPPALGATTFTLHLWEKGTPLTANTGAAIIHLSPAAQPALRATLDPLGQGTQFTVRGSLATADTWRAEVLVRTARVNEYRTLLFTFTIGPGAAFLPSDVNPQAITPPGQASSQPSGTTRDLSGVACPRPSTCVAVGGIVGSTNSGTILRSTNGGSTWRAGGAMAARRREPAGLAWTNGTV